MNDAAPDRIGSAIRIACYLVLIAWGIYIVRYNAETRRIVDDAVVSINAPRPAESR